METDELNGDGLENGEQVSAIRMLQLIQDEELGSFGDYIVTGFETLVMGAEDYEDISEFIREMLMDQSPYLTKATPTFQIEINTARASLMTWGDKFALASKQGEKHSLYKLFRHVEPYDDNPNWLHSQLNLT